MVVRVSMMMFVGVWGGAGGLSRPPVLPPRSSPTRQPVAQLVLTSFARHRRLDEAEHSVSETEHGDCVADVAKCNHDDIVKFKPVVHVIEKSRRDCGAFSPDGVIDCFYLSAESLSLSLKLELAEGSLGEVAGEVSWRVGLDVLDVAEV